MTVDPIKLFEQEKNQRIKAFSNDIGMPDDFAKAAAYI